MSFYSRELTVGSVDRFSAAAAACPMHGGVCGSAVGAAGGGGGPASGRPTAGGAAQIRTRRSLVCERFEFFTGSI